MLYATGIGLAFGLRQAQGGVVSAAMRIKWLMFATVVLAMIIGLAAPASAEGRKIKVKVAPTYPELARKMQVSGSVKMEVTVTPAGAVKTVKVIGGHPLLVEAASDAVKKWKYEAGPDETTESVEFKFSPADE
jgi:TonB family protein